MIRIRGMKGWLAVIVAASALGGRAAQAGSSVPAAQLEAFLGLPVGNGLAAGGLDIYGPALNGSAITQTITVGAGGGTLTFDYDFLTNAPNPASVGLLNAINPYAFLTVTSTMGTTLTDIADNYTNYPNGMAAAPASTGFIYQTGYNSYATTLAAGTYTIGFGVVDVTTDQYSSGLLLSDISLASGTVNNGAFFGGNYSGWSTIGNTSIQTSAFGINPTFGPYQGLLSTASVPEPSSIVMLVLGGLGVVVACRGRRATSSKAT